MSVGTSQQQHKPRFFYGWYIVIGSLFANLVVGSMPAFGLFFKPMSGELGWTRAVTTVPFVMRGVLLHFTGPIVGPLMDRFGPRYLMTAAAIVAGIGTLLMAWTNSVWQFVLFFSVIGALGLAGLSNVVTDTAIAKWFVRKRGRATGIAQTGINVGGAVTVLLAHLLIAAFGWRRAWMVLALIPWVLIAPTSFLLMRRAPEDMGLRPDGDPPQEQVTSPGGAATPGRPPRGEHLWTPALAFRAPTLWVLLIIITLANMSVSGVLVHQIPFLTDQGLSPGVAALAVTMYSAFAIPSKVIWGFLAERIHIRYLSAASLLGSAVSILILLQADTLVEAMAFGVTYGLTRGAWHVVQSLLWADYFGRHFLGTIRGYAAPANLIATVGGPLFAAFVYDSLKSYQFAFSVFVAAYVLSGLLVLGTRPPVLYAPAPRMPGQRP